MITWEQQMREYWAADRKFREAEKKYWPRDIFPHSDGEWRPFPEPKRPSSPTRGHLKLVHSR